MAAYQITGHPLGQLPVDTIDHETLRVLMLENGVGKTINITISGNSDTKIKGHGALK